MYFSATSRGSCSRAQVVQTFAEGCARSSRIESLRLLLMAASSSFFGPAPAVPRTIERDQLRSDATGGKYMVAAILDILAVNGDQASGELEAAYLLTTLTSEDKQLHRGAVGSLGTRLPPSESNAVAGSASALLFLNLQSLSKRGRLIRELPEGDVVCVATDLQSVEQPLVAVVGSGPGGRLLLLEEAFLEDLKRMGVWSPPSCISASLSLAFARAAANPRIGQRPKVIRRRSVP